MLLGKSGGLDRGQIYYFPRATPYHQQRYPLPQQRETVRNSAQVGARTNRVRTRVLFSTSKRGIFYINKRE